MSDESALAVQVAENQTGSAPGSGGKSGEGWRISAATVQAAGAPVRARLDGMATSQQELEKYMDELKAKVEKLAALDVANAFHQLAGLRRDLGHAVARIDALEALARGPDAASEALKKAEASEPAAGPTKWANLLGSACAEPLVGEWLRTWAANPTLAEENVLAGIVRLLVEALAESRRAHERALRERIPFVRPAAEVPRENPDSDFTNPGWCPECGWKAGVLPGANVPAHPSAAGLRLCLGGGMPADTTAQHLDRPREPTPERRGDFARAQGSDRPER